MPNRFAEPSELSMPNVIKTNAYATLAGALDELARRGFTEGFQVVGGGLRALGHAETMKPKDLVIREFYRFEGISDPDDMAILYALESLNGVRGTLADAFGVYADPETTAVLEDIPIRPIRLNGSASRS
jgi:hypothetical protein